jgi:SAM-dependent methyltransferase
LTEQDVFLDVGCGKGRVLAYLLKSHAPCRLCGIEINEISGRTAQEWTQKYDRVDVMIGDAFRLDYNDYTVLFLGRPFLPKTFQQFLESMEASLTHPITLIYWVDQQSGYMLKDRPGWEKQFGEKMKTLCRLKIAKVPQSYSIWVYDPNRRVTDKDVNTSDV